MKRLYIITGAKGHLASTIIRYLRNEDCHIRGLILPTETGEDDQQLTYYKGDVSVLNSLEAVFTGTEGTKGTEGTEYSEVIVIHAAGIISIGEKVTPLLYSVNVTGTRNIIAQCIKHNVKKLVYISSVHAIPESEKLATISETSAFSAESVVGAYASTKAEATQAVLEGVKTGKLNGVVVHPSGIIGPYDDGNNHVVQLIQMYISGKLPAGVTGGYDFVDVRDVAKGCLKAAEVGEIGSCYILSNRYFEIRELLKYVREIVGGKRKICLPMGLARAFIPFFRFVAKVSHTRPLYTKYALYTISGSGYFSHDKATSELGYHPRDMRVTIADTIRFLNGENVPLD